MLRAFILGCAVAFGPAVAHSRPLVLQDEPQVLPRVLAIEVEGNQRFTDSQLIGALGQEVGGLLSQDRIDAGIKTLWSDFSVHSKVQFRNVLGGVELKLIVQEMPVDLEPRFVGNVEEGLSTLLGYLCHCLVHWGTGALTNGHRVLLGCWYWRLLRICQWW